MPKTCICFIMNYSGLPVLRLVLFLVYLCILLFKCVDLHSPFKEINAFVHPPFFFPLPTIFLVSLLSLLLGEQLMRNKPLRHIKPYKKARAVIQWLSFPIHSLSSGLFKNKQQKQNLTVSLAGI